MEINFHLERLQKSLDGDIVQMVSDDRKTRFMKSGRSKRSAVSRHGPDNNRNSRRCGIFIHADQTFVRALQLFHITKVRQYIYDTIKMVNRVFSVIDFNQDQKSDNFTFYIDRLTIGEFQQESPSFDNAYHHLERISLHNHSEYCLAYYLTNNDRYSVNGLSWIGTTNKNTGLCSTFDYHHHSYDHRKSMNTALINFNIHDHKLFPYVMIHELAHSLGAVHDSETRCKRYATNIPFFMSGIVINATELDQMQFSICSVQAMAKVIRSRSMECFKVNAQTTTSKSTCGNKIVEPYEQCDCGTIGECQDYCCNPSTCQLAQHAVCSPSQGPCCNDATCHYFTIREHHLCQNETQCAVKSYCDGHLVGSACPKAKLKDDYTVCDDHKSCIAGTCQRSICSISGLSACSCPNNNYARNNSKDAKDSSSSSSCLICCQSVNDKHCAPLDELVKGEASLVNNICRIKAIQYVGELERKEEDILKSIMNSLLAILGASLLGFIISNLGIIQTLGLILLSSIAIRSSLIGFIITPCYTKIAFCCCSNQQRRMQESFYGKKVSRCTDSIDSYILSQRGQRRSSRASSISSTKRQGSICGKIFPECENSKITSPIARDRSFVFNEASKNVDATFIPEYRKGSVTNRKPDRYINSPVTTTSRSINTDTAGLTNLSRSRSLCSKLPPSIPNRQTNLQVSKNNKGIVQRTNLQKSLSLGDGLKSRNLTNLSRSRSLCSKLPPPIPNRQTNLQVSKNNKGIVQRTNLQKSLSLGDGLKSKNLTNLSRSRSLCGKLPPAIPNRQTNLQVSKNNKGMVRHTNLQRPLSLSDGLKSRDLPRPQSLRAMPSSPPLQSRQKNLIGSTNLSRSRSLYSSPPAIPERPKSSIMQASCINLAVGRRPPPTKPPPPLPINRINSCKSKTRSALHNS
ncbi:uncharacterized protein TRIADDRAFT_56535 [Trichoplax adhaerens]|uniref:Disintegrin domain-containing protein n=1 Tax=Trichoplax adhaerens TaxID=10228 RepID=B3RYF0_TRIAD|nr:predicted protein [Trichoplax adhaerens]EDV25027.1 predicted protein [Trichoplax adhaerens]|eukprot:XP_002112917.1 predicted protein [Trichoplax adhaerens]